MQYFRGTLKFIGYHTLRNFVEQNKVQCNPRDWEIIFWLEKSKHFQATTVAQAAAVIAAAVANIEASENQAPLATKDETEANEKAENKKPTSSGSAGVEAAPTTSARNSPTVVRDITNTATTEPDKKTTPQMTPGYILWSFKIYFCRRKKIREKWMIRK